MIKVKNISNYTIYVIAADYNFHRKLNPGREISVTQEVYDELTFDLGFEKLVRGGALKVTGVNEEVSEVIEVPYETLLTRVVGRRTCKDCGYIYNTSWGLGYEKCPKCGGEWGIRSDDNEETYKTRYDVYQKETLPILDYFKKEGKVVTVYGQDEPEQSYEYMLKAFEESDIPGLKDFLDE